MEEWLIAVLIGLAAGMLLGAKTARDSHHKEPVRGGAGAHTFHYLACVGMTSVLPFVIAGIILGLPFLALIGTGLGLLALTFIQLLVYALFERMKPLTGAKSH
ncbi:MAG: hypothetical protein GXY36_02160 [Chloroflexi bacterium]|jgi:hypothetical protein|nr:hypothetical protein [Chloroflexota bacterium]